MTDLRSVKLELTALHFPFAIHLLSFYLLFAFLQAVFWFFFSHQSKFPMVLEH
jgi:hypothetical protein